MNLKMGILFSAIFVLLIAGLSFAQDMNPEAGKLYNEGNSKLKAGNFKGAIENYQAALKIEEDYRIYYQMGVAKKKTGDHEGAKNAFEAALKLKPDFEAGYNAHGGVYFSMGNYSEAVKNFEKVLEISKSNKTKSKVKKNLALAYTKLGTKAEASGNVSKALEYLNKATSYHNYDAAYLSLARLYSDLEQWDKSIAAAQNALKYRTKVTPGGPYYYMGLSYKGKGDMTKAREMFNKAKSDATYRKTAEYELSLLQ